MKLISIGILIFGILVGTKSSAESTSSWKLQKNSDGILIESRKEIGSEYHSFKASMILDTDLETIVKELKDVNEYPNWFAFTKSTFLIYQTKNEQIVFMETDFPWPYQNEFMEYRMVFLKETNGTIHINIVGISKSTEVKQGLYPLKKAKGYIKLYPLLSDTKSQVKLVYFFHSEPRQEIPTWLINPMIHEMPYKTLMELRKRVCRDNCID